MIDLEYWANPEKYMDNFTAIYWSSKKILIPIAEKEIYYKDWIYELDEHGYNTLCDARRKFGYDINYEGNCKTALEARQINSYFISFLKLIKRDLDECKKNNSECNIKKIRHV